MLSLCAIVKNEQDSIERMLDSVSGVASELVVVDTGSTDETRKRASAAGAKVIEYQWRNDFADARNFSISYATEPWILVLDADEALDLSSRDTLRNVLSGAPQACWLLRRHFSNEISTVSHTPVPPEHPAAILGARSYFATHDVRLFPNRPEIRYTGAVHESVEDSLNSLGIHPLETSIIVNHFGHLGTTERRESKATLYLSLAREKVAANPDDWRTWYQLGAELQAQHHHLEAVEHFRHALAAVPDFSPLWRELGKSLYALGLRSESIECLTKALSFNSNCMMTWGTLGAVFLEEGNVSEAEQCFGVILTGEPENLFARSQQARIKDLRKKDTSS
jgi:tetratricopeptide (TPR) repeat protein